MGYYRKVSKFEMIKFILEHELWDGTKSKSSLNKKKWAELWAICEDLMKRDKARLEEEEGC